jgi:hypothetical protein
MEMLHKLGITFYDVLRIYSFFFLIHLNSFLSTKNRFLKTLASGTNLATRCLNCTTRSPKSYLLQEIKLYDSVICKHLYF